MSGPSSLQGPPIVAKRQLVEFHEGGNKPPAAWRVGTEHEKFVFRRADLRRVPYEGPDGIGALLQGMTRFGWAPVLEKGNIIALSNDSRCSITLEPGGQFELSGAPLETVHQTCEEVHEHLRQVREVCDEMGLGMIGLGFDPFSRRDEVPWMPKGRYRIMGAYMPKKGRMGLDMMLRTCTVQANLDYQSESDMVRKFRASLALQPAAVALFANSPFVEGRPSGYLSYRSLVWTDTDPDRCGTLPFVFEDGFGFERYVDYLLDVPMYFVYRDGNYIDASGQSFRDFMAGRLPAFPGELPRIGDWVDHMTTAFPRGAPQILSRNAWGRRRAVAAPVRAAGAMGRAAVRFDGARRRLRPGSRLDRGGARGDAARCAAARPRHTAPQPQPARHRPRNAGNRPRRAASPGAPRRLRRGRDAPPGRAVRGRRRRPHSG
jgi:glutamate--cysteine ligase